jgi:hypothetical protein
VVADGRIDRFYTAPTGDELARSLVLLRRNQGLATA